MNAAIITEPIATAADLETRATAAVEYFGRDPNPWMFGGSERWLGDDAIETLARLGLTKMLTVVGMVTDQLAPPTRPLPEVETRRIDDERGRLVLADVNAAAYDLPQDWLRGAISGETIWQSPLYGYVAYVDGEPASTAFAVPVDGVLNVGFVATATGYRGRGLAELVMRRSLEDATRATGITRTALHATSDGYPVYRRMGYQPVDAFALFTLSEAQ